MCNTKHGLLMVPALAWLKMVDLSDVIYASRAQAVLQILFVKKVLLGERIAVEIIVVTCL